MDWKDGGDEKVLFEALISSLIHETIIVPINLLKLTKMKTKHASVQKKKVLFIIDTNLPHLTFIS